MSKAKIGVCGVVVACAALMAGAKADAAPKSTMRSSLQSSAPLVLATSAGSKNAPTGAMIAMPASAPHADDAGRPQVSSLPSLTYTLPLSQQPLPPGVIFSSNQVQRMSDRVNGVYFQSSSFNRQVNKSQLLLPGPFSN